MQTSSCNCGKGNPAALLPIGVFLILYLGLGILLEFVLKVQMGFYSIPIVVCFLAALGVALMQNSSASFDDKLAVMAQGIGDKTLVTMLLIFLEAGIFVGVVGRGSAQSVAYCMLSIIPPEFAVLVLFAVSCFVSLAMGTSCGTITLITPIAAAVSTAIGFDLALCVGSVMGGAMFGDNLSFISDTTIAVCNGQGCQMKDKFRENFKVALCAAVLAAGAIWLASRGLPAGAPAIKDYSLLSILPYLLVLGGGILGANVFLVLLVGIVSGLLIMVATGAATPIELMAHMGKGAASMFETSMVAVLVTAISALVQANGGFQALLYRLRRIFSSRRGGKLGVGILVGAMDIATANNTVAIMIANPIARRMSADYGISAKETASILDTWSCVFQGILPYGAQMLIALGAVAALGHTLSAFDVLPMLFYPFLLGLSSAAFILLEKDGVQ